MIAVPLGELDGFAGSLAEVIQFRPAGFAATNRSDIENVGRMNRENPLDSLVINNTSYCEGFVNSPIFAADHRAGKYLCPGFIAFLNPAMDIDDITNLKVRNFILETFALNSV